ncbi:MAG: metal ABC transporter permease [Nitrospiraceae bacterium]|nr:metal ABC transporter permease [Nitrospiraceae bacterium]
MTEILSYGFIQRSIITGIMVAILTGIISVFVVLRRVSFVGSGISHAAFGGVAIGFLAGINPLITAMIYSVIIAFSIERISSKGKVAEDTAIGIFFSSSMALGIVLISLSKSYNVDLFGYLFGSILAISESEMWFTIITSFVILIILSLIIKYLLLITFNEELAVVSGIPTNFIKSIFLVSMAVAIVMSIKVVGIILVSALLVIPGAVAQLLTRRFYPMLIISCLTALFSTIAGLYLSYRFDISPGGAIVLTLTALFFITLAKFKKK